MLNSENYRFEKFENIVSRVFKITLLILGRKTNMIMTWSTGS